MKVKLLQTSRMRTERDIGIERQTDRQSQTQRETETHTESVVICGHASASVREAIEHFISYSSFPLSRRFRRRISSCWRAWKENLT